MMNTAKTCPLTAVSPGKKCDIATSTTFAEFNISSMAIRTPTVFRRASVPYSPTLKSTAERTR